LDVISVWLLVFASFEKLIVTTIPNHKKIFLKAKFQRLYLLFISIFNMLFYLSYVYLFQIQENEVYFIKNKTEEQYSQTAMIKSCNNVYIYSQKLVTWMSILNRAIIPFSLISLFTLLTICAVFKSRNRVIINYTFTNRTFRRDLKFSIKIILLNVVYFFFCLIGILLFFMQKNTSNFLVYLFTLYL